MVPRFDKNVTTDDARKFLNISHYVWSHTIEMVAKININIKNISLIDEEDILTQYSKERLYGERDGIHFAGKDAPNKLAIKLVIALRCIFKPIQWSQLPLNKTQDVSMSNSPITKIQSS